MAKPHQRVFALITAILFFVTTIAFSALVVWQIRKDQQAEKQTTNNTQQNNTQQNNQPQEGKLQGTKLMDFTPQAEPVSELKIIDLTVGTGDEAKADGSVTAHYTGALVADGTIFQSSKDTGQPFTSALGSLIEGWKKGIPGMKVGGKRRLVIPYAQAYGDAGRPDGGIPAKADLVFDIELISVQ